MSAYEETPGQTPIVEAGPSLKTEIAAVEEEVAGPGREVTGRVVRG